MRRIRDRRCALGLAGFLLLVIAMLAGMPVRAAEPGADFYQGKTLSMLIGVDVGGEYDTIARLVARHLGRNLPGSPNVVPQNMIGASGLKMANHLATIAPQDGTVIGMMSNELPMNDAMGNPGIQFDSSKLQWIGSPAPLVEALVVWKGRGIATLADARQRDVTIGTPTKTSIHNFLAGILNHYSGTRFRMVTGYSGGGDTDLAMERGEVDGRVVAWSAIKVTKSDWLRDGKLSVLAQFGPKAPDLPNVPSARDLATDETQRKVIDLLISSTLLGRPLAVGPGVAPERVALLRAGFGKMLADPAFLAEAASMKIEIAPVSGERIQAVVRDVFATPKEIIALAKKMNE